MFLYADYASVNITVFAFHDTVNINLVYVLGIKTRNDNYYSVNI